MSLLKGISTRIGNKETPLVIGYALRLITHMAGIHDFLRSHIHLRHITMVGIRGTIEVVAICSQLAIVRDVLGGSYCPSIRIDILDDVRPVHRDGYQGIVYLNDVIACVTQTMLWILLLIPLVDERSLIEIRDAGVVHAP